jgi:hypothetical protein
MNNRKAPQDAKIKLAKSNDKGTIHLANITTFLTHPPLTEEGTRLEHELTLQRLMASIGRTEA